MHNAAKNVCEIAFEFLFPNNFQDIYSFLMNVENIFYLKISWGIRIKM